jgi:hypothetical protein
MRVVLGKEAGTFFRKVFFRGKKPGLLEEGGFRGKKPGLL